jgi:hypothetical protein
MKTQATIILILVLLIQGSQSVFAQSCDPIPEFDKKTKAAVIDSIVYSIDNKYVFPEKSQEIIDYLKNRFQKGAYSHINSRMMFAQQITADLKSHTDDLHFNIAAVRPGDKTGSFCPTGTSSCVPKSNDTDNGFKSVKYLPDKIGYFELTVFMNTDVSEKTAVKTMEILSDSEALIIDLRNNIGGDLDLVQFLASYLMEPGVELITTHRRNSDDTDVFSSLEKIQGKRMTDIPVYILTSHLTASSGEAFAYILKHHGRAKIIGEKTVGTAHCAEIDVYKFSDFYLDVRIPTYKPVHPKTGGNWEDEGVVPDVMVAADEALEHAQKDIRTSMKR